MAQLTVESARAEEGSYIVFTVRLSEAASTAVTVDYLTYGLTGTEDVDFNNASGTLSFAAGETVKTISVYARSDSVAEGDKALQLELTNPVGASFGGRNHSIGAVGWVLDDDIGGGQPAVAVSAPVVMEGNGRVQFLVSLSEAFSTQTKLDFHTISGSALAGQDFVGKSGQVTFQAGQTEALVSVNLKNDAKVEAGETFGLVVDGAGRYATGEAHILNDDGAKPILSVSGDRAAEGSYMEFTVRLSEASSSAVSVAYRTFDGSALSGDDYNITYGTLQFDPGETTQTISVYARSDSVGEPDRALELELFNPLGAGFGAHNTSVRGTGWVLDDDAGGGQRAVLVSTPVVDEGAGRAVFTINLSEAFTSERTLRFETLSGSALAGSDIVAKSGRVTFAAGQTEAVVAVGLKDDGKLEGGESFSLKVEGAGVVDTGQARILDDDSRKPIVSIEGDAASEGDYLSFLVRLSKASSAPISVDYQTIAGTAIGGTDYNATQGTLQFAAGETVKVVQVYASSDSISEPDEYFNLELSNAVGAGFAKGDPKPAATGFVLDDDPGFEKRILEVSDVRVAEDGGRANFRVGISQALDEDLVIRFRTEPGGAATKDDYVSDVGRIVIAAGSTEGVISIKIKDDGHREGSETFKLKLTSFDRGDFAPSGHDLQATATIIDDDGRGSAAFWHGDTLL